MLPKFQLTTYHGWPEVPASSFEVWSKRNACGLSWFTPAGHVEEESTCHSSWNFEALAIRCPCCRIQLSILIAHQAVTRMLLFALPKVVRAKFRTLCSFQCLSFGTRRGNVSCLAFCKWRSLVEIVLQDVKDALSQSEAQRCRVEFNDRKFGDKVVRYSPHDAEQNPL